MPELWGADRSDWILLALKCAHRERLTAVKLQKTLFLLGERRKRDVGTGFYHFRPYHYGPFAADIYHDADALEADGLIEVDWSNGRRLREYALTGHGQSAADEAARHHSKKAVKYLDEVVAWAQPLPFHVLVRAIYEQYPAMRANSIFEDR